MIAVFQRMAGAMAGPRAKAQVSHSEPALSHSYAALGEDYARVHRPTPVSAPHWMAWNADLAQQLNWPSAWRQSDVMLNVLSGNEVLSAHNPVATVYAGHQFGSFNPQLGDGRALLLGEWVDASDQRWDIQLKGAGPTPYSRGGDGRSPVGPVVREYLVSEAMAALGVPTTRALAAVATGDRVYRNDVEPGAVLTRVARSHLRIGTVQYFAMTRRGEGVTELVDYVIERHDAAAWEVARNNDPSLTPALFLLRQVSARLATLVAQWQVLGFVHGVLNTDNMLLCGDTIDFGPCAFMDIFDPKASYSAIDTGGRYAWPNQPSVVHWNIAILAESLLPFIDPDETRALTLAQAEVDQFPELFARAHRSRLCDRFGLRNIDDEASALLNEFQHILASEQLDYTLAMRWLTEIALGELDHTPLPELFQATDALTTWRTQWQQLRARQNSTDHDSAQTMSLANPIVIPRNHWVAAAIANAEAADYDLMCELNQRWQQPFVWQTNDAAWARTPAPEERVWRTFCGT
jgi:uncharacterized protein YdiU (UPF0061 family)